MNTVRLALASAFLFLTAFVLCACRSHSERHLAPHISPEMTGLISARHSNDGGLSIDGLPEIPQRQVSPGQHAMEIFTLPPPIGSTNHSSYTIFLDHITGQYWIERSGEPAGETKIFGPGNLPKQ